MQRDFDLIRFRNDKPLNSFAELLLLSLLPSAAVALFEGEERGGEEEGGTGDRVLRGRVVSLPT